MTTATPDIATRGHAKAFAPPLALAADGRKILVGLSREQLEAEVLELGEPKFRAKQLWQWIYNHGASSFDVMTSLGKPFRAKLEEAYVVGRPEIVEDLISVDGTRKWLLRFADGNEVETVFIPEEDRGTLCVSSQVGCTLTCKFCHTGTQPLVRNLSPNEIVSQIIMARDAMEEWPSSAEGRRVTNIVMMGMGEPLYNYENVAQALKIVMDGEGLSISRRRITLSTSGVVPEIRRCGAELNVNLAVSLHAVTDEVRSKIMPINNKYPLAELLQACREYPGVSNARRITFEYVMLKDVNDSLEDAKNLIRILKGIPAKINLIPFNPWPGSFFECSSKNQIRRFSDYLFEQGVSAPVRTTRGEDILAACGQLKSESERKRKTKKPCAAE
ncbi:23S rRNA (adenine(2503)-C(2))-methyltransferase RlmN [Kiloniella laminariae]|uniref:Dual-specificity RNA methyltransferase RlmN n=1 Tax=Kiloniella laminariae TaxID=454162 RepID=A0ABT4LIT2_9PROT|nr:23S rRNA (adenine(2503)-C(2))-methyltransferase RlmN [Kiloniella laminariae]MCZ4281018.1 23S rRNA (adenine(2503)-C(2))-methyltransferase RlmN [Kiloniella laminariae]